MRTRSVLLFGAGLTFATINYAFSEDKAHAGSSAPQEPEDVVEAKVGKVDDLKDGEMKEVVVGEVKVLLARIKGKYYAIINKCSHFGAPLSKGILAGEVVACPWHSAEFSVVTGESITAPAFDAIPSYPVRVEGNDIIVTVPVKGPERLAPSKKGYLCGCSDGKRAFVVVGSGAAGYLAAQTLRQDGFKGRVILVTKEDDLPYDRTMLSKAVGIPKEKITLRDENFFKVHDIEVFRGSEVAELDATAKKITFKDGSSLNYENVLLATGAAPIRLNIPGAGQSGVYTVRNVADSTAIAQSSDSAPHKKVVVVGASFVGMEVAAALRKNKNMDVTVVALESVPFERTLGPLVGSAFQQLHEENGVHFKLQRTVKEISGNGQANGVILDNGEKLDADLVVLGVGVKPTLPKLKGITPDKDGGLTVDSHLKVADGVYAAGDIARFPYRGENVRIEHWAVAQDQGKIAAHNMVGQSVEYKNPPFFWTNQFGQGLRYAGYASSYDSVVIDGDVKTRKFIAYYVKDDKVVAIAAMGRDPAGIAALELLKLDKVPSVQEIRSKSVDLAQRVTEVTA